MGMNEILTFLSSSPWFNVATAVIAVMSAVAAATPTPKPGTTLAKAYKLIDWLALNVGHAKA
jgi:hypothetical protein